MTSSALVLLILGVSVSALSGDVYLGDAVVTNAYPNETLPNESLADGALPEDANPIDALSNLGFAYDKALATQHAALSFAAYCPNNAITSWSVGYVSRNYPDLKNIQVFEDGFAGTKGYIGYNAKLQAITVVFRGSSNIQNWIENIQFGKTKYPPCGNCYVHDGFYGAYGTLKAKLDSIFPGYLAQYNYAKLHIMGHSLGGAMATFFALELAQQGRTVQLSSFGSPRIGDPAFYDWFEKYPKLQHFRVVHERDTVPHLPLYAMNFYHVNREIWYHDGKEIICQPTRGEDHNCSWQVSSTSNADHSVYMGWSSTVDC